MAEDFLSFPEDPTKTVGVRKRWISQLNKRFRKLKSDINKLLLKGEDGGVAVPHVDVSGIVVNQDFVFSNDVESVARFMAWLDIKIQQEIIGVSATPNNIWHNQYINQAYSRGIKQTLAEMRKLGITSSDVESVKPAAIIGSATPNFVTTVGSGPIHLDAIRTQYFRTFSDLNGVTDEMSKQINRVLVDGMEQGLGIKKIAKNINNRVDKIGLTRAKLIARTETARSYNSGTIAEFEDISTRAGTEPKYQWITAGDGKVRPSHATRNKQIYTKSEALSRIGEPNCRCALKPHIDPKLLEPV